MEGNGKWRDMFEQEGRAAGRAMGSPPPVAREQPTDDDGLALDLAEYRPWILQRGRSHPAMMLHLRRYEPKSGLWTGWQMSYPQLAAVDYVGDRMLSLDFGQRQFVIEGIGLSKLARHLQDGTVLVVQEYSAKIWTESPQGNLVRAIGRLGTPSISG